MKVCLFVFFVYSDTVEENSETKFFMFYSFFQRNTNDYVSVENIDIQDNLTHFRTRRDECLELKSR
jgi:hypothetical protein